MKNIYQKLVLLLVAFMVTHATYAGIFDSKNSVATELATIHEKNGIDSLAFSPDGSLLVVAKYSYAYSAQVWNWSQSQRVGPEFKHGELSPLNADALQFSIDGEKIIWCGYAATVWRFSDGVEAYRQKDKPGEHLCSAVAYSPSGDIVWMSQISFVNRVHTLAAYDTKTWQLTGKLESPNFFPSAFSLSFDGNFAAIAGNFFSGEKNSSGTLIFAQRIRIFDLLTKRQVREFSLFPDEIGSSGSEVSALAWAADGKSLAVGFMGLPNDGADAFQILDGLTGKVLSSEPGQIGAHIRGLRFTSDGKYFIVAGILKSVKIWDGKHTKLLQEISAEPASIAISQDGHYLALGGEAFGPGNLNSLLGLLVPSKGKAIIYQLK